MLANTEQDTMKPAEVTSLDSISYSLFPTSSLFGYTIWDKAVEAIDSDTYLLYLTQDTQFLQKELEGCYEKGAPYVSTLMQVQIDNTKHQKATENAAQEYWPLKNHIQWKYPIENAKIDSVFIGRENVFFSTTSYGYRLLGPRDYQFQTQISALHKTTGELLWNVSIPYSTFSDIFEQDGLLYGIASNRKGSNALQMVALSSLTGEVKYEMEFPFSDVSNVQYGQNEIFFTAREESETFSLYQCLINPQKPIFRDLYTLPSKTQDVCYGDSTAYFISTDDSTENQSFVLTAYHLKTSETWFINLPFQKNIPFSLPSLYQNNQMIYVTYESTCSAISKQTRTSLWNQSIKDYRIVDVRCKDTSALFLLLEPISQKAYQSSVDIEKNQKEMLYNRCIVECNSSTGQCIGKSAQGHISNIGFMSFLLTDHLLVLNPERSYMTAIPIQNNSIPSN
jgi:hypothetical protein